jgi:DNA-binding CsgD family transcriptional regulator
VSKHTATDYVRKIYDKLDVNGHDQLMKKLESITVH